MMLVAFAVLLLMPPVELRTTSASAGRAGRGERGPVRRQPTQPARTGCAPGAGPVDTVRGKPIEPSRPAEAATPGACLAASEPSSDRRR